MVLIHLIQDSSTWIAHLSTASDSGHSLLSHSPLDWSLLAQQQFDTDVFAGARRSFDNFIKTGQVWALIIGVVLGYFLRSLTSYG